MSAAIPETGRSFVLLRLTTRRFALPAETVIELVVPGSLQNFPHTSPLLLGVLLRRGQVVPVADIAQIVAGPEARYRKFYLVATRHFGAAREWCAIPVMEDCELISSTPQAPEDGSPAYITGALNLGGEHVPILDLDGVFAARTAEASLVEARS